MIGALLALSYADRHTFLNALRSLRHAPWRAVAWASWVVLIVVVGTLRATRSRGHPRGLTFSELAAQDLWVCALLLGVAALLAFGGRFAGFFTSRVEALLLIRAPYPPQAVAAYLQVRAALRAAGQGFTRFGFLLALTGPLRGGVGGLFRELALFAAGILLCAAIPLPRSLARGATRIACVAAGCVLALFALIPIVRDALIVFVGTVPANGIAHRLPAWHPGVIVNAVVAGDLLPLGVALACVAIATAVFALAARDAYPELYAFSVALIELRARAASGSAVSRPHASRSIALVPLRGALAFVGVDALTWWRRGSWRVSIVLATFVLGGGALLGLFGLWANDQNASLVTLSGTLPTLYVAFAATATVQLAADLRRPLFWLGGEPLVARLAAWTYAPVWRDALYLALFALGFGAVARDPVGASTVWLGGVALALLARAVSAAVFALLPNAIDQRGPAVTLRFVISYALMLPTAILAIATTLLLRSLIAGGVVAVIAAGVEGALLLAFAASRLAGGADRLAAA